jgi:transglutaminase-like putative cysteine protease
MRYKIRHSTEYKYQELVSTGHNRLCLVPLQLPGQILISSDIKISPTPDEQAFLTDFFGNTILFISIYKEHDLLTIHSESVVDISSRPHADRVQQSILPWQNAKAQIALQGDLYADVIQYTLPSLHVPYSQEIRNFTHDCFPENSRLWDGCHALMKKIYNYVEFKPG